jgi:GTP-binding protein
MSAPMVAIIGRPNVGKSTLFNRVLGARRAVVHDRPGVTRDRNSARAEWSGRSFVLVDTGGFLPTAAAGREALVRQQAELAIDLADVVILMVDGITGATDLDGAIARALRRRKSRVLLVVNKVDRPGDLLTHDFHRLGLGGPIEISAEGGLGIGDLLDSVIAELPATQPDSEDAVPRVAIVGRPNVGKSSIVNALLGEERVIVEATAGTTMDAIDAQWETPAGNFVLVDTAGIRRQAHFDETTEFYAAMRALRALERADIACLVVDATQGFMRQEARLAQNAFDAGRPVLLLYNKWDLVQERDQVWKRLAEDRIRRYPSLADLPALPISATRRIHLQRLPGLVGERVEQASRRIGTAELNRWLEDVQRRRAAPTTRLGHAPRLYYATQTGSGPPEFALYVNAPERLSREYRRFLWSHFAERFGFRGTPVRFHYRKSD